MDVKAKIEGNVEDSAVNADAAKPAGGVMRHMSGGLGASLEQFDDPTLLAEGKISIIALDAVVERFGARWSLRRDQVYDHVERTLDRYLGLLFRQSNRDE